MRRGFVSETYGVRFMCLSGEEVSYSSGLYNSHPCHNMSDRRSIYSSCVGTGKNPTGQISPGAEHASKRQSSSFCWEVRGSGAADGGGDEHGSRNDFRNRRGNPRSGQRSVLNSQTTWIELGPASSA